MMLRFLTVILVILEVDAHAPPPFPSSECNNDNFRNLFKCHKFPDIPKHIHKYSEGGIELDSRHPNPYRIYVNESLVDDVCSYLEGVGTCMQNSYNYLEINCPPSKLHIVDSFQRIVKLLCTEFKPDFAALLQCGNADNSKLMTFSSCIQGAYDYIKNHGMYDCSLVDRLRECHCQYESCSQEHTTKIMKMIADNKDTICYLMQNLP